MSKNPFDYQAPKAKQTESIQTVRTACKMLHRALLNEVPPGRERSLAITKLEEVSMWANKGIVFEEEEKTGGQTDRYTGNPPELDALTDAKEEDEVIDQAALDTYVNTPKAGEWTENDLISPSGAKSD